MTGPRTSVVVGAAVGGTVGRGRAVVAGTVAGVAAGLVDGVVDVAAAVSVDAAVVVVAAMVVEAMVAAGSVGAVGADAGAVANSNGVAVTATAFGVQPVTTTVPPSAAAFEDAGQASHATPPATSAVTTPIPTTVLRCSSPSRHVVRANVPPGWKAGASTTASRQCANAIPPSDSRGVHSTSVKIAPTVLM
jgi:hypothetical protein